MPHNSTPEAIFRLTLPPVSIDSSGDLEGDLALLAVLDDLPPTVSRELLLDTVRYLLAALSEGFTDLTDAREQAVELAQERAWAHEQHADDCRDFIQDLLDGEFYNLRDARHGAEKFLLEHPAPDS